MVDIENIYNWYCLVGSPNRGRLRQGDIPLPKGVTRSLIESLIPYFKLLKQTAKGNDDEVNVDKDNKSMVITSDWHIPFQDTEVLEVFFKFLKDYQPDEVVLNGNINDCLSFSPHPKLREVALTFSTAKKEREVWFSIASRLRNIVPNAKITYVGSQCHEGWIDKWAVLNPILLEDEGYTTPNWFKLKDFGIDYVNEVYSPLPNNKLIITHGTIARNRGGSSAQCAIDMEGTNVIIAHTHKLSQVFKTTSTGVLTGIETGCMCRRTPWYYLKGKRLLMDWQQGFCLINVDKDNNFATSCIPISRDKNDSPYFCIGKEVYK